ncbi:MAG: glycosyltransferase family 4 protein [Bacteroidetes bacterium]|nr:glycosyltransferase family 4 protein [Bacteroidota bacterium]MCW5897249.1 glycosyltransferase family 4 protein [Bacteroidota bacterium]
MTVRAQESPQTMDERRVLVIAYYFPPMGLSGVQRTLKFVKYFPEFGWKPTVLTVEPVGYFAHDDTLLKELEGRNVEIVRTNAAGPGKVLARKGTVKLPSERTRKFLSRVSDTFFIPDNKIGWKRKAVRKALELHQAKPFDLLFATAPPFTDFLIGAEIKSHLNIPLVFDYRDAWVEYPHKFYPTPYHKLRTIRLERNALKASSHVVTTNRNVKELLIKRHRFLGYNDVEIIPQGYDPDDFAAADADDVISRTNKMRITYAGVFWEDRVPTYFLQALHALFQEQPRLRDRIEALFIGKFRKENIKLVQKLGLKDSVIVVDYLPHRQCVNNLVASDVLWMIVGDNVGSPGKVYEYIGARKPILGCVPDGFMKQTILEAGGVVTAPNDVDAIKHAIEKFYRQYEEGTLRGPVQEVVEKYDRPKLTGKLVRLFESLLAV